MSDTRAEGRNKAGRIVKAIEEKVNKFLVIIITRVHLLPFRTQKLSSYMPKILVGYPTGKIGRCQIFFMFKTPILGVFLLLFLTNYNIINLRWFLC